MKILSWNVNGIRAREKAGLLDTLKAADADIVCLQEVRARPDQLAAATKSYLNDNYATWFISEHAKAGYSGVLIAAKDEAVWEASVFNKDSESGRAAILEFNGVVVVSVYTPNSGRNLDKLEHRLAWENELKEFVKKQEKPVIICGDMNVAPEKQDCNVFSKAGTSKEERAAFTSLLEDCGLVDTYHRLHPLKQEFTWFSNMYDSRAAHKGMRIDHFLVPENIFSKVNDMIILNDEENGRGSDHAPIVLDINLL